VALLNQYSMWRDTILHQQGETYYNDPFLVAASSGSIDALRALLEHHTTRPDKRITFVAAKGHILLHAACRGGHIDTVRFLLDNGPTLRDKQCEIGSIHDKFGTTALLDAARLFPQSLREKIIASLQIAVMKWCICSSAGA
jgi:ankyrin repeat protein